MTGSLGLATPQGSAAAMGGAGAGAAVGAGGGGGPDVVSMLISIYGSQAIFMKEYRWMGLGDRGPLAAPPCRVIFVLPSLYIPGLL